MKQAQRKRFVYSSLDSRKNNKDHEELQSARQKSKPKKSRKDGWNVNFQNAARIYLNQIKPLSKLQAHYIINNNRIDKKHYRKIIEKTNEQIPLQKIQHSQQKDQIKQDMSQKRFQLNFDVIKNSFDGIDYHIKSRTKKKKRRRLLKMEENSLFSQYCGRYGVSNHQFIRSSHNVHVQTSSHVKLSNRNVNSIQKPNSCILNTLEQQKPKQQQQQQQNKLRHILNLNKERRDIKLNQNQIAPCTQRQTNNSVQRNNGWNSSRSLKMSINRSCIAKKHILGYVINEKQQVIKNMLESQGWKMFGQNSEYFTLKWTYNQSYKDYQLLKSAAKSKKQMYFNHISQNKLVNKDDLCLLIRNVIKYTENKLNINITPETYILSSERNKFLKSYEFRSIYACLKIHAEYFTKIHNFCQQSDKKTKFFQQKQTNMLKICNFMLHLNNQKAKQLINKQQSQNLVINIPLLYNLLVLSCNIFLQQIRQDIGQFHNKFNKLINDSIIMQKIVAFSRTDMPILQHFSNRITNINKNEQIIKTSNNHQSNDIMIINGYLKMVNTFATPSEHMINATICIYNYFCEYLQHRHQGGSKNIWIIKPCSGSKGGGIQIIDRPDRVNQISQANSYRIVQKYIQNIWTFKQQHFQILGPSLKYLDNKKFDIRQWVLIHPPNSYIFSSFYLRVCSKQYTFLSIKDSCSHLSNFSINRQNFTKPQQSVISEEQFAKMLQSLQLNDKYLLMKHKIKQKIKILTQQAMRNCQIIPGTFQIVGFDILVDDCFQPWIIQCNMSPACNIRTDWLKQMKQSMARGALQIVLSKQVFAHLSQNDYDKQIQIYKWLHMSQIQIESNIKSKNKLQKQKQKQKNKQQPIK